MLNEFFVNACVGLLTAPKASSNIRQVMDKTSLDELQQTYKSAVDEWVTAIRAEESLATPDHSETAMERWDRADFDIQATQKRAHKARDEYKEGLRRLHYGI
jgi:gas vesicle protein